MSTMPMNWASIGVQSYITPGLLTHVVQELYIDTLCCW